MNNEESEKAVIFIKQNKKKLVDFFIPKLNVQIFRDKPVLICMAGSSGAGKTETATTLMENFGKNEIDVNFIFKTKNKEFYKKLT